VLDTERTAHLVTLATFSRRSHVLPPKRPGLDPMLTVGPVPRRAAPRNDQSMDTDRRTSGDVRVFGCAECPRVSSVSARGWRAYRVTDPDEGGQPELLFICPDCARREFDDR
jgi:hypothetical protein